MTRLPRQARLVVRIYLFSLATVVITALVVAVTTWHGAPSPFERAPPVVVHQRLAGLASDLGDPAALAAQAAELERASGGTLTVFDRDGTRLLGAAALDDPPGHGRVILPLVAHARTIGMAVLRLPPRPRPPDGLLVTLGLLLVVLMGVSLAFARRLAVPLSKLEAAARSFGEGRLDARSDLRRGDEIGAVGRAFDAMADRITRLMRAQRELLANVSHELRTPLSRVQVALDLAAEGDAATASEMLADIHRDVGEIGRLVDDVLTSAKLDLEHAGTRPLRCERVELGVLCARAAARHGSLAGAHPLTIETGSEALAVVADPALLRRALDNLLDNAAKYSEPGSPIRLRAQRAGDRVLVEVVDRGIGIDEADRDELFTPFFRSDRSRARATGGFGLGLALARQIVAAHGGSIRVASQVNLGTTMTIDLPAAAND
jgi:two-component system OmpR family sensor kinase